jgi:hypothetical protein
MPPRGPPYSFEKAITRIDVGSGSRVSILARRPEMHVPSLTRIVLPAAVAAGVCVLGMTAPTQGRQGPPSEAAGVLDFLEPLIGRWEPDVDASVLRVRPELRERIVHDYAWTVGRQAIRVREGYRAGHPDEAELEGLIFTDPATQRVELIAVAGHGAGQGRLFRGEYVLLADGRIERVYDVHYRTPADMPGEELGGTRRRYREIHTIESGDRVSITLDWWRDGGWQPFAVGKYAIRRVRP